MLELVSDARLRELERRWRETRAHEDELAWLRARLRAGELGPERLGLAAWCGHRAAREALEDDPEELLALRVPLWADDEGGAEAGSWAPALVRRAGREGAARAAAAAARASSWWAVEEALPGLERRLQPAVLALERWADCPCDVCLEPVRPHARGESRLQRSVAGVVSSDPAAALLAVVAALCLDRYGHAEPWRTDIEEAIRRALAEWALSPRAA